MCNFCSLVAGGTFRANGMTDAGAPVIVTFSFQWTADAVLGLAPVNDALIVAARQAMDHAEEVAGIRAVEVDSAAPAMVRFAFGVEPAYSWATYPSATAAAPDTTGYVAMSPAIGDFTAGGAGYEVLLHEIGHALGLKHPFEGSTTLDPALDNTDNTIMSYTYAGPPKSAFQALDVAALASLYGTADALDGVTTAFYRANGTLVVGGSERGDVLIGVNGRTVIRGFDGDDTLIGRGAGDRLEGGNGDDSIAGLGGDDLLFGGGGSDVLDGGDGNDRVNAGWGHDTVTGGAGNDTVIGEAGADHLSGGDGDDQLLGYGGNDVIEGDAGDDRLGGYQGDDILRGGEGNDTLVGGLGRDALWGGPGEDVFILLPDDYDAIVDFEAGTDRLDVSRFSLTEADARGRLTAWRDALWFDTGGTVVQLVGLDATAIPDVDFLL